MVLNTGRGAVFEYVSKKDKRHTGTCQKPGDQSGTAIVSVLADYGACGHGSSICCVDRCRSVQQ